MGSERVHQLRVLNKVSDFLIFIIAFVLGVVTKWYLSSLKLPLVTDFSTDRLFVLFALFCTANYLFLSIHKIYPTSRLRTFGEMAARYFKGIFSGLIAIIVLVFIFHAKETSRILLVSASVYGFLLLLVKEYLIRKLLMHLRLRGQNVRPVVLVGQDGKSLERIYHELTTNHLLGIHPMGVFTLEERAEETIGGFKNLGSIHNIIQFIEEHAVENVIFLSQGAHSRAIEDLLFRLEKRGIEIWLNLGLLEREISRVQVDHLHDVPFLTFRVGPQDYGALMIKNFIDRLVALILLILFSPLFET